MVDEEDLDVILGKEQISGKQAALEALQKIEQSQTEPISKKKSKAPKNENQENA